MEKIEIWKDVVGYEGLYQVSSLGRIRSLPKVVNGKIHGKWIKVKKKGIILKPNKHNLGYLQICLYNQKKQSHHYIHRLVANAFIPNIENKKQVNHINCNKRDNRVENLEWVTANENMRHAVEKGLHKGPLGEKQGNSILKEKEVLEIRSLYNTGKYLQREIGEMYGVSRGTIGSIVLRKRWCHI